jgi:3-hydroxyisobutyrate dehydrogenase-like beta-hydroxyacid dehydrogenase
MTTNGATLGFIGLGRMGGPLSGRLIDAGHRLVAFDAAGTRERAPGGATVLDSTAQVAAAADIVFLSLPDGPVSRTVCSELAEAPARRVTTVIDLSTIGIAAARECGALLERAGIEYLDAPVSGGVAGARSGSLAIMVGASQAAFDAVEPLLAVIARHRFRVGDAPGQGQAMKLLNNFLSGTAMAATSEAAVFGVTMGLDLAQLIDVLNASSGRNTATTDKFPRSVIPGSYDYGFAGALMTKDVALYLENAEVAGVPREIGQTVAESWQRFNAQNPSADFTYFYQYLVDMLRS